MSNKQYCDYNEEQLCLLAETCHEFIDECIKYDDSIKDMFKLMIDKGWTNLFIKIIDNISKLYPKHIAEICR